MESIKNFIRISDEFSCSGQPTEAEFVVVKQSGVQLVVNLAMADSDFALPDERATVQSLGMDFVHIPVPFSEPTLDHFRQFEAELLAREGARIFVHCALNWRASSFMALFAERHLAWTSEQAEQLRCALWKPNATWNAWTASVRRRYTAKKNS